MGMTRMLLECSLSDKLCVIQEKQYEVIIVPTLLVTIFLILLGVILWLFIREQRTQQQRSGPQGIAPVPPPRDLSWEAGHGGNVALPLKETSVENFLGATTPALAKLQVPREQLSEVLEQICSGSCGPIFRANMNTGDPSKPKSVILKALKEPAGLHEDVMTMDGLLYDLTEKQVYHIGKQVLLALEFLQEKHLFHGDVAARNILMQSDLTAKLCGLGLAYEVYTRGAISSTQTIPLKWLAPERLLLRPASIRADVWSFGILLYEMVTLGAPPYPEVPPTSILEHLQRRKIMKRPSSCTHTMYSIMKSCWRWREADRPSPRELRLRLEAAIKTADDEAVLQVPELVVPELYAAVAGIRVESLFYNYSML
ncbi:tyrosine-protein kinase STYK1 isoform X2 [Homo sapiens]|uniref:tyrosine-protein kinase STYK1 isoform X2 n=1 Tax=Homo sapiens TaxID=9606 RepID=UPI0005D00869|nr:tyrosine-protein kinase STYK1 isoform X2 [Homo sapiens]XP_054228430.1 tyrosine-protein kinase STYK1 isoform X2 [Homo sapiens]